MAIENTADSLRRGNWLARKLSRVLPSEAMRGKH